MKENKIYLCLENIRSSENVGAIFRTADAVGVDKIFLVGYTPSPIDRFGREQRRIAKSALGAEKTVSFEKIEKIGDFIEKAKAENLEIISVEQSSSSINYQELEIKKDTVFVFGNEVEGVSKELQEASVSVVDIPMKGKKESLNVSVSVGVFLYRVLDI